MSNKSNMRTREVYFENFNILTCILGIFTYKSFRKSITSDLRKIYYFDSNILSKNILAFIFSLLRIKISKLEFKMLDIVDENGELARIRIPRVDLYDIQEGIIHSDLYMDLSLDDVTSQYILKEICNEGIMSYTSSARLLYIIQVVNWHLKKNIDNNTEVLFFIDKRNWLHLYKAKAKKYNINLVAYHTKKYRITKVDIIKFIYGYPQIYKILKKITLYVKK